jgi:hypothetical protein
MSPALPSRSADLRRLRDEGYEVTITQLGYLVIDNVPYLNSRQQIAHAKIISKLEMNGESTASPVTDHVVFWTGEDPCDPDGVALPNMVNPGQSQLEPNLLAACSFSCKPTTHFPDYHAKVTNYIAMVSGPAEAIDPTANAKTFRVTEEEDPDSPFVYPDTASSRAGIAVLADKLSGQQIAVVGLGGSGAHVFDHLCKTRVKEIHIFDGDDFFSHNAFRAPGAASLEELNSRPKKVDRLKAVYSVMKRGIEAHPYAIGAENVHELEGFDFVFLSMEGGALKRVIVNALHEWGTPFIDLGMGLSNRGDTLGGVLRTTTSTPDKHDHIDGRIDFSEPDPDNVYDENIQVSDLNALNAVLAVIKWKKLMGVYADLEHEHFTAYTLDGNAIVNEEQP